MSALNGILSYEEDSVINYEYFLVIFRNLIYNVCETWSRLFSVVNSVVAFVTIKHFKKTVPNLMESFKSQW